MKFGQLIEYNVRNIFFKKNTENEAGRLVTDLFLFLKNALYEVQAGKLALSFNIFNILGDTIKTNCVKIQAVDPKI